MRLRPITLLPAGILTLGGALMGYIAWSAPRTVIGMETSVLHPVTRTMEEETAARSRKAAPVVNTQDYEGKPVTLGGKSATPRFVYFVKKGCPCSYDAEPLFQAMQEHFGKSVAFVSVSDADVKDARKWSTEMGTPYPVVSNPKADIMKAYGARSSVYCAVLDREGRIVKMWPGYSRGILMEINATLAKESGTKARPFDAQYAPVEKAAGCAFSYEA